MAQQAYSQPDQLMSPRTTDHASTRTAQWVYPVLLSLLSLALLMQILMFPRRVTGDVSMFLDVGDRILQGQVPFVDIIEINVPINHYFAAIPAFAARALSVNPVTAVLVLIWLCVTITAFAAAYIARGRESARIEPGAAYVIPLLTLAFAQMQNLILNYGQREHYFTLGILLWLLIRWQRWEGRRFHPAFAALVGIVAGVAVTFKPHFVPFMVVIEVWGFWRWRSLRGMRFPEIGGALVVPVIYVAYLLAHPQLVTLYLEEYLPLIRAGYNGYGYMPPLALLTYDLGTLLQLALCLVPWIWRGQTQASLWTLAKPLSLLALGGALHFAIQAKGWAYHRVPFDFFTLLLFAVMLQRVLTDGISSLPFDAARRLFIVRSTAASAWIVLTLVSLSLMSSTPLLTSFPELTAAFDRYSDPGDYVLTVDDNVHPVWPGIHQAGLWQASRYFPAYVFPLSYYGSDVEAIYAPDHQPPPAIQRFLDVMPDDIQQYRPELIVIRTNNTPISGDLHIDMFRFLEARGVLRDVIEPAYVFVEEVIGYRFYVRRSA